MLRIGGGHRIRKALFLRGIREGHLNVDEVEEALPEGLMTAAERWLLYFSLRASEVELRDSQGRPLSPDDIVPEHRRRQRAAARHGFAGNDIEYEGSAEPPIEDQTS